jgi:hypothetical protein
MSESQQSDEIAVMLRQLDILELRLGNQRSNVHLGIEQTSKLLGRLREVTNLAVEVNVSSGNIHVGGDMIGGDKVGGDKAGGNIEKERIHVKARDIKGSQIGRDNLQVITDSFNEFAAAHGTEDDLAAQMKIISDSVAALVAELQSQDPNAATEVTDTFQSFAEETTKEAPRPGTLRALGKALIDSSKKVAKYALPIGGAVAAVMQIFGIPAI